MKKAIVLLMILWTVGETYAQQDAIYSQYMFNPFAINPAYAGSRESVSGVLLARSQWLGIDGAPETQTFSIHSPIARKKMALGFNVTNDQIGPTKSIGVFGTYAYHLRLGPGKLSMALRGGLYSSQLDLAALDFQDPTDQFAGTGNATASTPTFDFGSYYYTKRFYVGLAVTHLSEERIDFFGSDLNNGGSNGNTYLSRHYMLASGYAFPISDNVIFKPSFLAKYVVDITPNIDVNASFLFKKVFWLGASYRSGNGFVLLTEYNITDFLRLGYSYDIVTNALKSQNRGTHEIFIGFDFAVGSGKNKAIDPRYL